MVCMKMSLQFAFVSSAVLANIIIPFTHFITKGFPIGTPIKRYTSSPIRMLIASVFLSAKFVIALSGTKMVFPISHKFAIRQSNRFSAVITGHCRECRIVCSRVLSMLAFEINGITSSRTAPSDFGLLAIRNKFFSADFAYQLGHNHIILQYLSFNNGIDYRALKSESEL